MASGLSDEELRRALRDLGEDVGPITPTTRGPWERKLNALRPLNALSSDESEAEPERRRVRTRAEPQFKKPAPVYVPGRHRTSGSRKNHPRRARNSSPFDVETSDSDTAAESPRTRARRPREVVAAPITSTPHSEGLFRRRFDSEQAPHPRFIPSYDRLRREQPSYASSSSTSTPCNGFLSNGGGVMGLAAAESAKGRGHCVPRLLLLGAGLFFLALGALYVTEVRRSSNVAARNYSKFCKGVNEELCKPFLYVSQELHQLLTHHAGEFECGVAKSRNLSVGDARAAMKKVVEVNPSFKMEQFDKIFNHSVSLFKNNEAWGIRCLEESGRVGALEAAQAAKSVWCRIRFSLAWTLTKLVLLAAVCVMLFVSYLGAVFWKKRRESQEKLFYEMVEKVIDILQEPSDLGEGSSKAVVNVRDALIPAKERKSKLWLWERVVSFIEENESRVSVEFQTINGEDFKVWRWNPSSANAEQNENGKQGKVWQGQAFGSLGKSKNTYTPTPCLKIRNMFDPEEYGDDWQVSVRDAILEKCEGNNGIRHIAFDTSNNEGCVYMMCSSEEAAGKAYNDLHGWWFDGKLVTVKYLKRGRYLQRFSEAEHCTEPLRPSNDKRLSLAAPYFSSALERS